MGIGALEVGAFDRAEKAFGQAAGLAPGEPAIWANRGVLRLRRGDYPGAAKDLATARALLPGSVTLEVLQGMVDRARGRSDQAVEFFKQAADRGHVKARYALMKEVEKRGGAASEDAAWLHLSRLMDALPESPALWIERARQAARRGDRQTLTESADWLGEWVANGPPRAVALHRLLAQEADFRQAAVQATFLHNVLLRVPAYRQAQEELAVPANRLADPVDDFLRMETPRRTPARPDLGLAFTAGALPNVPDAAYVCAVPTWFESEPGALCVSRDSIRGTKGARLSFPGDGGTPSASNLSILDWDNDFRLDLALAGEGGFRLYGGNPDGGFADLSAQVGLGRDVTGTACLGVWSADVDLDGDLDLILGRRAAKPLLLRNNGDRSFTSREAFQGIDEIRAFVWADLDNDGDPDAAVLDGQGRPVVFPNTRTASYRASDPVAADPMLAIIAADLNRDGTVEMLGLDSNGSVVVLTRSESSRLVARLSNSTPLLSADLDNNGGLDVMTGVSAGLQDEASAFHRVPLPTGHRATGVTDWNGDGRLDLVGVSDEKQAVLLQNAGHMDYHWQAIRPRSGEARGDGKINALAFGSEVEVRAGLLYQKQIVDRPVIHFGLGDYDQAEVVRIVWPNGSPQAEFEVAADQVVQPIQRLKGSCPWVFAFDGEEMAFVTDFLWRSPLGMRINAQDVVGIAQTEDWVRILGDQLVGREGVYDIRITAELWETHFVDAVGLLVVDHPEGTAMWVDERFGRFPPDPAVHLTTPLTPFRTVRDDRGTDVSQKVAELDGAYLDTFGRGRYQGITKYHWIEVAPGEEVPARGPLWLIGEGWVRPTDSSINVAIAQGNHPPPRGLRLEVFDGVAWQVVHPDLGFPAGKTKSVLIDLTDAFPSGVVRRFRLGTNLEIYWDRLGWAVPLDVSPTAYTIPAKAADLRYRGFSRVGAADESSPDIPAYGRLAGTGTQWLDLEGYYTGFGDVRPLLERVDDRYMIMNAGDELALAFETPQDPPAGLIRDFVLTGDGWVKDGDFNTAFSTTVAPLPAHDQTSYSTPPGELEQDPVYLRHAEDWSTYHTRYVAPVTFHRVIRPGLGSESDHEAGADPTGGR